MSPNAVSAVVDADLLELARTVERCVPADAERARESLRSLNDAIRGQHEQPWNIPSQRPLARPDQAERLCLLIARIAHDLAGGHVLAVCGLERQVKHYLERAPVASEILGS